jgi:hypothetical protein
MNPAQYTGDAKRGNLMRLDAKLKYYEEKYPPFNWEPIFEFFFATIPKMAIFALFIYACYTQSSCSAEQLVQVPEGFTAQYALYTVPAEGEDNTAVMVADTVLEDLYTFPMNAEAQRWFSLIALTNLYFSYRDMWAASNGCLSEYINIIVQIRDALQETMIAMKEANPPRAFYETDFGRQLLILDAITNDLCEAKIFDEARRYNFEAEAAREAHFAVLEYIRNSWRLLTPEQWKDNYYANVQKSIYEYEKREALARMMK